LGEGAVFINRSELIQGNSAGLNYGIAVTDVDNDGEFELFVTGFGYPNRVLKWNGSRFVDIADLTLGDAQRQSIGVAAGDFDGDGREEIYVLNTDTFMGRKRFGDRLFAFFDGEWLDLFELPRHQQRVNQTAGRSVACLDRDGDGRYGFFVANYGGPMRLYEFDSDGLIIDAAEEAGLNFTTGGRSLLCAPLVSPHTDVFAANENAPNLLFRNLGNGRFEEVAWEYGLADPEEHGRGVALLDANDDGELDIVYGNWEGPHRLFIRNGGSDFIDVTPPAMAYPSRIRTVIAADFDNDGYEEIFFNNIAEPNRLFGWRESAWEPLNLGEALESYGFGTGAAVGDFDGDGRLELVIAHGESARQPLTLYHTPPNDNAWLRILPLTRQGAPARGATVTLYNDGRKLRRVIDSGSGYLCQMEPVAHFGLGKNPGVSHVEIRWADGSTVRLDNPTPCQTIKVKYPGKI
jgi:hypothetical protein